MISTLSGRYDGHDGDCIVLDVGGVGYQVRVPQRSVADCLTQRQVRLWIRAVYRETSQALFGFTSEADRDLFARILKVDGFGPSKAMCLLDVSNAAVIEIAVSENRPAALVCSGISRDSAVKLIASLSKH